MSGQERRLFSSFDTYLAPFVKADQLNYEQVEKMY